MKCSDDITDYIFKSVGDDFMTVKHSNKIEIAVTVLVAIFALFNCVIQLTHKKNN